MSKATRPASRRTKHVDQTAVREKRVTARIVVDENGDRHREYRVGGRSFGSIELAIEAATPGR